MRLYFKGHDCKYAVEQMMLTMYPNERPEYPEGEPSGDCAVVGFYEYAKHAQARCTIYKNGEKFKGAASVMNADYHKNELSVQSEKQRVLKLAFYNAAVRESGKKPAWGAITGIRPASLMSKILEKSATARGAISQFVKTYDADREKAQLSMFAAKAGARVTETLQKKDICLYIGIPFCPTRCAYCSFVSQSVARNMSLVEPFLDALMLEMTAVSELVRELNLRVISVYVGGGTPTTLSAEQLERLLKKLHESFELRECREICVEAGRPDTVTAEKMKTLAAYGVSRVSINPQTMDDEILERIGRNHTAQDILDAVKITRESGDFAINMDLIAGLPGDTGESFSKTLDSILALEPENITVHTLAKKKGSDITTMGYQHSPERTVAKMLLETHNRLMNLRYFPYYLYRQKFTPGGFENTGWCRKGFENLYNMCIMEELCTIIAMGGGASTKLVASGGKIGRFFCPKYPQEYISGIDKVISDKTKIKEFYNAILTERD